MQQSPWKAKLRQRFNDPYLVLREVETTISEKLISRKALELFPLRVPKEFVDRIQKGDPNDPLLKQILPVKAEELDADGFTTDPLAELDTQVVPGLLHKYHGRALLIATGACAIHCRYCFRRHFSYADSNPATDNWQQAIDYLKKDSSISEIILSGGDPLSLSDQRLSDLIQKLADISHLQRLRIHSRTPIVQPGRVNEQMLKWLTNTRLKSVLVVHTNHGNELDKNVATAIQRLCDINIPIFNQSVLLKGINDSADILSELSVRLFDIGIIPYYLHMLDPVAGTAHFKVDEASARSIMVQLHKTLPGYLVPRLVREIAGVQYKIPVEMVAE
jgi:EF-P beta-lysylation protein EpmB